MLCKMKNLKEISYIIKFTSPYLNDNQIIIPISISVLK